MVENNSVKKQIIAAHAVLDPFMYLGAALTWSASSLDRLVPATAFQLSLIGLVLCVTAGIALMCIRWQIVRKDSIGQKMELQDQAGSAEAHLQAQPSRTYTTSSS